MRAALRAAVSRGALRPLDWHFAQRLARWADNQDPLLLLAAALVSRCVGAGDVCLKLDACADLSLFRHRGGEGEIAVPDVAEWAAALRATSVVGEPGTPCPLILDDAGRLYLARYWQYEQQLLAALGERAGRWYPGVDRPRLGAGLERLFGPVAACPADAEADLDWQRIAAAMAVLRPFCMISGGPGTGKTRTAAAILALLGDQPGRRSPRLALAAPTGQAAARLARSIHQEKQQEYIPATMAAAIPEEAVTLHRLLGFRPGRAMPRHGPENPLHVDALLVDEASMVDLPLMAHVVAALPREARLILLGDRDQLAAVEAGAVLGDIAGHGTPAGYPPALCAALAETSGVRLDPAPCPRPPLAGHIVVLRKSWRFGESSGIGALARAVNSGDGGQVHQVLSEERNADVALLPPTRAVLDEIIVKRIVPVFRRLVAAASPEEALRTLSQVRVLGAVRDGEYGVRNLNRRIEAELEACGVIQCTGEMYVGRPILVTANDHSQQLYNGDVGLLLPDRAQNNALRAWFVSETGVRQVLPTRLPPHETVYAMTVHKSQGSEFDQVVLVLPPVIPRVVTRELVYTGITRARTRVDVVASQEVLRAAVQRRVMRSSGLRAALWDDDPQ